MGATSTSEMSATVYQLTCWLHIPEGMTMSLAVRLGTLKKPLSGCNRMNFWLKTPRQKFS